jgi:hypothetical protein
MPSAELAPCRLLEGGAGEHERRLLASARFDQTPSGAKARVAAALGGVFELHAAPSAAPAPGASEPAARSAGLSVSGTRWGLGVVGAAVVGAIALSLGLPAATGESSNAGAMGGGFVSDAPPARDEPAASPAEHSQQPEPTPHAELSQQRVPARPDRSAPERPKKEGVAQGEDDSGLLAEVRALEAVSSAIGAGQPDRAARALDAYRRRFARGELAVEADVLAIEIAVARGDERAASTGAERLLARPEAEHYRARVHALLERRGRASASPNRESVGRTRSNEAAAHIRAQR